MAFDTHKPTTLADVLDTLTAGTPEDTIRQRVRVSSVRRIAEFLHRPPSDLPADIKLLRRQLQALHSAQCGVSPKTLANIKSNLADALRASGAMVDDPRRVVRSLAWEQFLSDAPSDHQRWGLSRFVNYCAANGIEPADVDQQVFNAFHEYLDARLLAASPADHCKSAAGTWNHLLAVLGHPYKRIFWVTKKRFVTRPLTDYPLTLQREIETYLNRLQHGDIFEEDGPDKPLRPTSIRNIEAHLRQFLDALVSADILPESLTSLEMAVTSLNAKMAFKAMQRRRGSNTIPSGFVNIAATLTNIARHQLKVSEHELEKFVGIKKRLAADPRGMSEKNKDRLSQFGHWGNVGLIVTLPSVLIDRANERPVDRKSALLAMHAATVAILLSCPMRAANVAGLDLDRHLRPTFRGTRTSYAIRIDGSEVKNGEPIEVRLNPRMSQVLHRYITQFRPLLSRCASNALFPRESDGSARAPSNFSADLKALIERETGLEFHMHLFRHFAAMLYLKERPGDFETVRRLLKHKRLQTTMDYYASLSSQWAHDHYDAVVLSKWENKDD